MLLFLCHIYLASTMIYVLHVRFVYFLDFNSMEMCFVMYICLSVFGLLFLNNKIDFVLIEFFQYSASGEDRVVVGSLDLNQCLSLPDEIVGMKPEVFFKHSRFLSLYVVRVFMFCPDK